MADHPPDAVLLTAPVRGSCGLVAAADRSLDHMEPGAVLEVPGDRFDQLDLAEWCLTAGKKILNPFEDCNFLLIENTP